MRKNQVGTPLPRVEAQRKVSGTAQYVDDICLPDMIHGLTIRSSVSKGKLNGIKFDPNFDWSDFTIVTAEDIPGDNVVALITDDQPYLANGYINHPEEPVALIAHRDKALLERARSHIRLDVTPETHCSSIDEAIIAATTDATILQKEFLVAKGDVDPIWKNAYCITQGTYETGAQEHLYIEPNGIIATASPKDGVSVMGSLQCPYYIHKALKRLFGIEESKIRVIQTETGGGFGGKEEYPSMIAGHAALLAWKSGKPVKLIYDRAEDMVATTKRHPSKTTIKSAVDKSGKLLALDIDFTLDGGAYTTLSPVVLSRGTLHAAGAYECQNIRIRSRSVRTNTPPNGAFRGFGAPQSIFAIEQHMNAIARDLKVSEIELRRKNFLKDGSTTATEQVIQDHVDLNQLVDRALASSDFEAKRKQFSATNKNSNIKRGIGIATFMHGAGFTGSGEKNMASVVGVEGTADGKVRILAASTEIGQGTNTIFTQIACDALNLDPKMVEIAIPDTKFVPNSGPTVASRTTMVVGKLVQDACESLKVKLIDCGVLQKLDDGAHLSKAISNYVRDNGELKVYCEYQQPPHIKWDDKTYKGDAYGTYAWAVYVAEVSIDMTTYQTYVEDFVALQEVGKVVNPILAAGQIEGGVSQGIGFALFEKVVFKNGSMANNRMTNYIIPTASDYGPIRVEFDESPYPYGPRGAKGIGELPLDGAAPAVTAAIENALGISVKHIPFMPEDLMEALANE